MLDEIQKQLSKHFPDSSWLGNQKHVEQLIDWTTFYRRNIAAFIEDYLHFKPFAYQDFAYTYINEYHTVVIVASRAAAKTYMLALICCAICILYPNTWVVIVSGTKNQASLIITEKIEKELMPKSANLRREIKSITRNTNTIHAKFHSNSTITAVPNLDSARGNRSTFLILEEFRKMRKDKVDEVAVPFQVTRRAEYLSNPKYEHLAESPKTTYISSSGTTGEWIWDICKSSIKGQMEGKSSCLIAFDESVILKHKLKLKEQLMMDKKTFDPITWRIEVLNEMFRENLNAYFTYDMLSRNQRCEKAFYPRKAADVLCHMKNPYSIPKQPNEVRLISCDFAFVEKKNNDNSSLSCIRLLPESTEYASNTADGSRVSVKQGYRRVVPYLEARPGGDVDRQAIRIKQLFEDFDADYVVLDMRNGGVLVYDRLAKVLYDNERDKEYAAWTCFNDENVANRVKVAGALPVVFAINATQKLNSEIATCMREVLVNNRIDLLIEHKQAVNDVLERIPGYTKAPDADTMIFYERPYLETQALIGEMMALEYEIGQQTGVIKIFEVGTNTKDRYTSVSYGNYFASLLEQDLLSDASSYKYICLVN